jgi:AcrR family transcriptional regulator
MPRTRDHTVYSETQATIKKLARQQMASEGTAAISLRAIARDMEVSAPALYRYYATREDLITALIVDAFNALADALERAEQKAKVLPAEERLIQVSSAYRRWALEHPTDFQLIYGNPIPGYVAPKELTVPAVVRTFAPLMRVMTQTIESGAFKPQPPFTIIPEHVRTHEQQIITEGSFPLSVETYHLAMICWSQMHGIVMLELFNHIAPNVGDVEMFYHATMRQLLTTMGMRWS